MKLHTANMKTHKDWFTAIHEAGHAVAYFIFAEAIPDGFESVTVEPEEDSAGHLKANKRLKGVDPDLFNFEDFLDPIKEIEWLRTKPSKYVEQFLAESKRMVTQQEIEAALCILLAGEAATYIETGERDEVGSGRDSYTGDFGGCFEYVSRLFLCGDDPESPGNLAAYHYLEALFWRTVCLLERARWTAQITGIAQALVEKRTLSADQCRQIGYAATEAYYREHCPDLALPVISD